LKPERVNSTSYHQPTRTPAMTTTFRNDQQQHRRQ